MSKNQESYEDQILKEFESSQDNETQEKIKSSDLGKVKIDKGVDISSDPEIQRVKNLSGYVNIPLDCLPSGGRFYPENTRISIRAARVGEIRDFSTIDEEDRNDIRDKMTYIVSQCTKVYYGDVQGYFKDLLEDDRIVLVFKIRELTFIDGQTSIKIPVPAGACGTPGCHPQEFVDFNSNKFQFLEPSPELEKYYDSTARCYKIQTKNYGEITLYPPTIGVTTVIMDWIKRQHLENKKIDAPLLDILQYSIKEWRGLTDKQIFAKLTELAGWSAEKFSLVYRLREKVSVGIKEEITEICSSCGGELTIPITFPDGFKSLFIPTISDLGDELL